MDLNRLTEKAQQAVPAAKNIAVRMNHQQIDVEHLLLALLDQEQGLVAGHPQQGRRLRRRAQDPRPARAGEAAARHRSGRRRRTSSTSPAGSTP